MTIEAARTGVKPIAAWTYQKQIRRAQREREFAAAIANTNAFRFSPIYGVIHSDELHRTALPSAKNCVLFLWAPPPMLFEAMSAIEAWGFIYKSGFAWVEPICSDRPPGHGGRFRRGELILVGVKGRVPAPAPGTQNASVIEAEDGREAVGEMIARLFPSTPCLDLFRADQAVLS
jgi:N6-adenosine-specific RNA methylase IME4